jgi:hypothetical protein
MSAVGMLAMLQRYLGIAAIALGAVMIFFSSGGSLWQRMLRSVLMALSALPAVVWYLATSPWVSRRAPIGFVDNFSWFSKSILEWFLPAQLDNAHLTFSVAYPWIFIGGLVVLLFPFSQRTKALLSFATPLFVYAIMYVVALFGSASITYFNKLGGRFLLPLYIPFATLLVAAIGVSLQRAREFASPAMCRAISILLAGVLVAVAGGLLRISVPLVFQSHSDGVPDENAFNTRTWRESGVMEYWLKHQPEGGYLLLSNYPDGVAFYTSHDCYAAPRRFSGPYGKEEFPVAQYAPQLFSSGLDVYLLWIEPNAYPYYYGVHDLAPIAQIQPLFLSQDGGVYRLRPSQPLRP